MTPWRIAPASRAVRCNTHRQVKGRCYCTLPILLYDSRMTALPKRKMTVAEFLPWAMAQEQGRYELVRGDIVAMAPERARHNIVKMNVARALQDGVRRAGLRCIVFTDGITVVIDKDTSYEPDAAVQCGTSVDLDSMIADKPMIVAEVTSPSSEKTDAAGKLADYLTVASIAHVLIVDPVRKLVIHHARGDGAAISTRVLRGCEELRLEPPSFSIFTAELFEGV